MVVLLLCTPQADVELLSSTFAELDVGISERKEPLFISLSNARPLLCYIIPQARRQLPLPEKSLCVPSLVFCWRRLLQDSSEKFQVASRPQPKHTHASTDNMFSRLTCSRAAKVPHPMSPSDGPEACIGY